jgi:ABC-type Fe3+/spermidine/putrescine transport system ATPase subunit
MHRSVRALVTDQELLVPDKALREPDKALRDQIRQTQHGRSREFKVSVPSYTKNGNKAGMPKWRIETNTK